MKRGIISSWIEHLQVWTGLDHVDSVIFDQVHIHRLDTLYLHDGLCSLNGGQLAWARWHIWMGPIVERSTFYLWRGSLCFLLLFSRVAVLFITRVFPVGNPYLILREGEVLELHFLIPTFWPSYLLQLHRSFCSELGCVAGCSKGGSLWVISRLVFQWRSYLSIGGSVRRNPRHIFISFASGQPPTIPQSVVSVQICVIFRGSCWEGSLSSSGGSISE